MNNAERIFAEFSKLRSIADLDANIRTLSRQYWPYMERELEEVHDAIGKESKLYEPFWTGDPKVAAKLKTKQKQLRKLMDTWAKIGKDMEKVTK